jgi:hypothetical protein
MDARGSLLHHAHGHTRLTYQHHGAVNEGAHRQEARDYTDYLQHLHGGAYTIGTKTAPRSDTSVADAKLPMAT